MKIVHRIGIRNDPDLVNDLGKIGFHVNIPEIGFQIVVIEETDGRWTKLKDLVLKYNLFDNISTKFNKKEIRGADWLFLAPKRHIGYPQPEDTYTEFVYDKNMCKYCGCNLVQTNPFRVKQMKLSDKVDIFQLNWVFGEYFIRHERWKTIIDTFGLTVKPILAIDGKEEMKDFVQLCIPDDEIVDVTFDELEHREICDQCQLVKYMPNGRGKFPRLVRLVSNSHHIMKLKTWFGSGVSGWKPIVMSHQMWEVLEEQKIKGLVYIPVSNH